MAKDEVVILYGSQTGQAEAIAENIHEATEEHDIKSTLLCLRHAEKAFEIVSSGNVPVIFVCSTTGDGEVPGNARKFMRMLQRRTLPSNHLANLSYALLGLGDSNYSTFCGGPKTLERALKKLGAKSFYSTGYADDGTDLEVVVEPWIEGLWPALKSYMQSGNGSMKVTCNGLSTGSNSDVTFCNDFRSSLMISSASGEGHHMNKKDVDYLSKSPTSLRMKSTSLLQKDLSESPASNLPNPIQPYLTYRMLEDVGDIILPSSPIVPYPLAADDKFYEAHVQGATQLTTEDAVKKALYISLKVPDEFQYEPGDSFGIYIPNPKPEVDWLLERLKVTEISEKLVTFDIRPDSKKKNAKVPNFIPICCTLRYILEYCLEIRSVPKRTFLRVLHDHASAESDKNVLSRLSCKEGMQDFIKYVREANLNILDILSSLPSCQPPIECLVEHLPRLKARLYSASSCQKIAPQQLRFMFNVINTQVKDGRMYERKGVCTGYLDEITSRMSTQTLDPTNAHIRTGDDNKPMVTIFKIKNENFRLPEDLTTPLIMVGPGTGVAPFMGFLELLHYQKYNTGRSPDTWLFYGCRHKERDFLFRKELNFYVESGTLGHLVTAFSRDRGEDDEIRPRYVQDNLKIHSEVICDLLLNRKAMFYVCGDARNMAKEVKETVVGILAQKMPVDVAQETVKQLVKEGRYKEDVWT